MSDPTVSEANGLASNSSHRERSGAERLWRVCFKKWFVAMVASWMKDEVVNHQVLVLIGKQGIYKTTWLERLIPPHLRQYCCKLANSTQLNKDDRLRIAEFGLINMDELDAMSPRELNSIKSVITASDVNERAAYGYTKERRMRLASFCASSNRREFLTDITGNRRWLPFEVESIQNPFFTTLPYDLMYAQAWALASDPNFSYWFELDEIAVLEQHNEDYRVQDSEEQLLPILFDIPAEGKGEFMTTAQISERLVTYGNIKKPMAVSRLGMLLGQAGYRAVTRGERGSRMRGWIVYQRDTEEIATNKKLLAKECVTV
jgi:predicted P-loop ATPase